VFPTTPLLPPHYYQTLSLARCSQIPQDRKIRFRPIASARNEAVCTGIPYRNFFLFLNFIPVILFSKITYRYGLFLVSGYGVDDRAIEVRSPAGVRGFSPNLCVQTGSGAHPAFCPTGTAVPDPGGKSRLGRDADHSIPSSAEVVNE
jgi:hypothetical protein